jgi:ribosomal protein S18 acetylase RimI-like enzyme
MMVHPNHFRRGIADRLLAFLEDAEKDACRFTVTAVTSNVPAVALYAKHDYSKLEETEIASGIFLAAYAKPALGKESPS